MKSLMALFLVLTLNFGFETRSFADVPIPNPSPIAAVEVSQVPASPTVTVPEPSAPPQWAQDLIMTAEGLPVVGPFIAKALLYLGILAAVLTSSIAFLLGLLNTLMGILNFAGFATAVEAIAKFRDGKLMYWLKFFSLFNAKKPEEK